MLIGFAFVLSAFAFSWFDFYFNQLTLYELPFICFFLAIVSSLKNKK